MTFRLTLVIAALALIAAFAGSPAPVMAQDDSYSNSGPAPDDAAPSSDDQAPGDDSSSPDDETPPPQ